MVIFLDMASDKFTPDHVTPHDGQTVRLFYAGKKAPKNGYPVLINTSLSGFTTATEFVKFNQLMTTNQSRIAYRWLLDGGVLLTAPLTVSRGGSTGNNVSDGSYDPASGDYGAAYTGNGVFIPPGENPGSAAIEPWLDPARHMPQKDVWYLRHWVAKNANTYNLDNGRVAYLGSSAGAVCGAYAIYGPDQRVNLGLDDVTATAMSWSACVAMQMPSRLKSVVNTQLGYMFPDSGDTPDFDTPATTQADADQDYRDALSFLTFDTGSSVPLYLASGEATDGAAVLPPYTDNVTGFHGVDHGAMIVNARPTQRFVATDDTIALSGFEDAVLDDDVNDDDSPFVADVASNLDTYLALEDPAMVDAFAQSVLQKYNSTAHFAGTNQDHSDFALIIAAGPHKACLLQNVTYDDADAILRWMTAGLLGTPTAQLGMGLNSPISSALSSNAHSSVFFYTAGEAIYAKSKATGAKADWQAIVYY